MPGYGVNDVQETSGGYSPNDVLADQKKPEGGFAPAVKKATGQAVKSIGQLASDYIPGVSKDNAVSKYGQSVIDANPTVVHGFSDVPDNKIKTLTEGAGMAAGSVGGVLATQALGGGLQLVPNPIVKAIGKGISKYGQWAAMTIPAYGEIREQQINEDPGMEHSAKGKLSALAGAGAVGAIESKFGPESWASSAFTKEGRKKIAEAFAAKTLPGAVAKGGVRGALVEGAEELVQSPIQQIAAFQDPTTRKNLEETAFGGFMGAVGGGAFGGGVGAASRLSGQGEAQVAQQQGQPTEDQTRLLGEQEAIQTPSGYAENADELAKAQAHAANIYAERDAFEQDQMERNGLNPANIQAEFGEDITAQPVPSEIARQQFVNNLPPPSYLEWAQNMDIADFISGFPIRSADRSMTLASILRGPFADQVKEQAAERLWNLGQQSRIPTPESLPSDAGPIAKAAAMGTVTGAVQTNQYGMHVQPDMPQKGLRDGATNQGGEVSPMVAQGDQSQGANLPGSGSVAQPDLSSGLAGRSGGTGIPVATDGSAVSVGDAGVQGVASESITPATTLPESAPAPVTQLAQPTMGSESEKPVTSAPSQIKPIPDQPITQPGKSITQRGENIVVLGYPREALETARSTLHANAVIDQKGQAIFRAGTDMNALKEALNPGTAYIPEASALKAENFPMYVKGGKFSQARAHTFAKKFGAKSFDNKQEAEVYAEALRNGEGGNWVAKKHLGKWRAVIGESNAQDAVKTEAYEAEAIDDQGVYGGKGQPASMGESEAAMVPAVPASVTESAGKGVAQTKWREPISMPDLIAGSVYVGSNDAGEQLYDNARGRFRVRHDRKKYGQEGYADFGGDLSPVEISTQDNTKTDEVSTPEEAKRDKVEEPDHIEDGATETVTPEIIRESVSKSAENTPRNMKEAREWLIRRVDAAIEKAPKRADKIDRIQVTKLGSVELAYEPVYDAYEKAKTFKVLREKREAMNTLSAEMNKNHPTVGELLGYVMFDVPGDGRFKVLNSQETLERFKTKVLKATNAFKARDKVNVRQPDNKQPATPTTTRDTVSLSGAEDKKPATSTETPAGQPAATTESAPVVKQPFIMTGSHRPADELAARGQQYIFDSSPTPAQKAPDSAERYEAGSKLTKEERKSTLKTLTDVYRSKHADKEERIAANGESYFAYPHQPELFEKSDITGKMVRFYVTLPDGRIAHPTELFPDYSQADVDRAIAEQVGEARVADENKKYRLETLNRRMADSLAEANRIFNKENPARADYVPAILTNGKQFIRTAPDNVAKDVELLGGDWNVQPAATTEATPAVNQKVTTEPVAKIEDFGDKIGGSRKDMAKAMRKEWSDDEIGQNPLSKIWPKSEVDAIEDKFIAAFAHAARDEVPSKPRKAYLVKGWVEKVKMLRGLASKALDGKITKDRFVDLLDASAGLKHFASRVRLLEAIDRAHWGRIGKVEEYPDAFTYDADGKQEPRPQVSVEIDDRRNRFQAKTLDDALPSILEKLGAKTQEKAMQFEVRGRVGRYAINKKGDPLYRKLSQNFDTSKDAFDYIKTNYSDLVAGWENVKESDNVKETDVRSGENRPRHAKDWRGGKDATQQQFQDSFGFRGVEWGNWVSQGKNDKERQGMLNQAYDALMDLSDIIGIPPKAISLNGSLGLGFGSRGHGWASAHFEPDTLVINLTKTRGAGSLGHEWFHALDNYFQLKRGKPASAKQEDWFVTYAPENYYVHKASGQKIPARAFEKMISGESVDGRHLLPRYRNPEQWELKEGVRPEVGEAFADLVNALNDSPMAKRASLIDKGKSGGYWSRIIERGARSFENYLIHKMGLDGYHNDYLANVRRIEDFGRDHGRYPYLLDSEIEPVAKAFDNLFATVQTKETDQGVVMFSRRIHGNNPNAHDYIVPETPEFADNMSGDLAYTPRGAEANGFEQLPKWGKPVWAGRVDFPVDRALQPRASVPSSDKETQQSDRQPQRNQTSHFDFSKIEEDRQPRKVPVTVKKRRAYTAKDEKFSRRPAREDKPTSSTTAYTEPADKADVAAVDKLNQTLRNYFGSNDYGVVLQPGRNAGFSRAVQEAIRAAFRTRVIQVVSKPGGRDAFNGFSIPGVDAIFVNANTDIGFINIAGHELLHDLKRRSPTLYAYYAENAKPYLKNLPAYQARLNAKLQSGESLYDSESALEELLADFMGDSLSDPAFLQQMADRNPSKFKQFVNAVRLWLSGVASKLRGLGSSQHISDVKALQKYLADVLDAYAEGKEIAGVSAPKFQRVYHGTPHIWAPEPGFPHGRPRLDKMGTGEGLAGTNVSIPNPGTLEPIGDKLATNAKKSSGIRQRHAVIGAIQNLIDTDSLFLVWVGKSNLTDADAASIKDIDKSVVRDFKRLGDLITSKTFVEQGYSGIDAETRLLVMQAVGNVIDNLKILDSVVEFIPIDVMNILGGSKASAKVLLNDVSMLHDTFSINADPDVSVMQSADTLIYSVAALGAEKLTRSGLSNGVILSFDDGTALSATKGRHGESPVDEVASIISEINTVSHTPTQPTLDKIALLERNGEKLDAMREAEVRFSRKNPKRFNLEPETSAGEIQRKLQDNANVIKEVQNAIKLQGGKVTVSEDVYHAMERMTDTAAWRMETFVKETVEPLMKRAAALKTNTEEIGTYLMALGAKDRNAYISTIRQDMPNNGSGMEDSEAQTIVDDYKQRPDFAEFDKLARDFQAITERKLNLLIDGGVITEDQAAEMKDAFGFYVPYKGFETVDEAGDFVGGNGIGSGYSTSKRMSKRAYGRISRAADVVENIIRDYNGAIFLAEKAKVGETLERLVDANPDSALWTKDTAKSPTLGHTTTKYEIQYKGKKSLTMNSLADAKKFIGNQKNKGDFTIQRVGGDPKVQYRDLGFDNTKEVRFIRDGKDVRIQIHHPLFIAAYNKLNNAQLNAFLEASSSLNSFLRQMYTQKNPVFIFKNAMRDVQTGYMVLTGEQGNEFANKSMLRVPKSFKNLLSYAKKGTTGNAVEDAWYKKMREWGGGNSFAYMEDVEAQKLKLEELLAKHGGDGIVAEWKKSWATQGNVLTKVIKSTTNASKLALYRLLDTEVLRAIENVNMSVENAIRLSAFREYAERNGGLNASNEVFAEASRIAKNVTVNFNRKGEFTPVMNSLYLFWNANVQGTQNIYRSATDTTHKKQVQAIMAGLAAMGFLMGMATGDDDDELSSEFDKHHNALIHAGDSVWKIPLAYGLGFFFGAGYTLGNLVRGRRTYGEATLELAGMALEHFSPLGTPIHDNDVDVKDVAVMASPTIFKPLTMSAVNKNTFGTALVPHYSETDKKPDSETMYRATRGTLYDQAANNVLTKWADVSPETLKMLTNYMTGGVGGIVADSVGIVANPAINMMNGVDLDEGFDVEKLPVLKSFHSVQDVEEKRGRFYKQLEDADDKLSTKSFVDDKGRKHKGREARIRGRSLSSWRRSMSELRDAERDARNAREFDKARRIEEEQVRLAESLDKSTR